MAVPRNIENLGSQIGVDNQIEGTGPDDIDRCGQGNDAGGEEDRMGGAAGKIEGDIVASRRVDNRLPK